MSLLGLDTSTAGAAACVLRADGEVFEVAPEPAALARPPAHARELMPAVAEVMARAGLDWNDLEAIAVGVGPGSFTGLRIGVTTARALAGAAGLGLRPVSSLAALAAGIGAGASGAVALPLIDAKRGEVFAAAYDGETRIWAPFAASPDDVGRSGRGGRSQRAGGGRRLGTISRGAREGRNQGGARRLGGPRRAGAAHLPARNGPAGRATRGRSPRLPESPGRQAPVTDLEIRPLTYADLPQVIAIERRAFPTPWSLAMFVLELSKPSGICLAALIEEQMVGYLVCSRYDTVWHLMNIAVDDRLRRQGIATALLERLFELGDRPNEQYTLEVRTSNDSAIRLYEGFDFRTAGRRRAYYHDNREDALIMWRTVPQRATA